MVGDSDLDAIKRHFGIYWSNTPGFDKSALTLLNLGLPREAVIEIISGIWREAWDAGVTDGQ